MKVYEISSTKFEDGKFYRVWDNVPEGFPLPEGITSIEPPKELKFPKWDNNTMSWIEDKDSIIESFKEQITDMQSLLAQFYEGGLS